MDAPVISPGGGFVPPSWLRRPAWLRARVALPMLLLAVVVGSLHPMQWTALPTHFSNRAAVLDLLASPRLLPLNNWDRSSLGIPTWISDAVLNVLLYLPIGLLIARTLGRARRRGSRTAAWLGLVVMVWLIECLQSLQPGRFPSVADVICNALGAGLGLWLGPVLLQQGRRAAFRVYCLSRRLFVRTSTYRRTKVALAGLLSLGTALAVWQLLSQPAVLANPDAATAVNWFPFAQHLQRSPDVALRHLAGAWLWYALLAACLTGLHLWRTPGDRLWFRAAGVVLVMAAGLEYLRLHRLHGTADLSGPVLALSAFLGVMLTMMLASEAIARSCRRRQHVSVAVDRRRR